MTASEEVTPPEGDEALTARALRSLFSGGWVYFGLFIAVHVLLASSVHVPTGVDALCLLLVTVPQLIVILRHSFRLPVGSTLLVSAALVLAAGVGLWSLTPTPGPAGYDAWFFGAITFDLLGYTLAGRYAAAWLTMLAVTVLAVVWAALHGEPAAVGGVLVIRHVATLGVGTALSFSLRRSNAAAEGFRSVERLRRREEDVARARAGARRAGVEQVLEQAGPTLAAIAAGHRFTEEDRRQMLVIEGALRDQIRVPVLARGPLRTSLEAARRRGVNVLLLDEADPAPGTARRDAIAWLADRLDAVESGGFVGRLRPAHDGGIRASAVADDTGEASTFR